MDLDKLKEQVKEIAMNNGAKLVGIGSQERLKDAPPSGDMNYILPGAQSCIIWAYPTSFETLKNYFAKKERMSLAKEMYLAYSTAWTIATKIAKFIEKNSDYKALPVKPNGQYRLDDNAFRRKMLFRLGRFALRLGFGKNIITKKLADTFGRQCIYPDFSLRYGAVAAGLGHLGWSGMLVTSEFGGALHLGGVLTTAPLEPDPMAEESNCNKCKLCVKVCNSGYFSKDEADEPIIIAGQEEIHAKRNIFGRCGIGCLGWTGLIADGTWSTWGVLPISIAKISEENMRDQKFLQNLMKEMLFSKDTPKAHRNLNKKILDEILRAGIQDNVGLRPLEDTNPRCNFCSGVCVADFEQRKELFNLLKQSGTFSVDEKGKEFIRKLDESGNEIIYYPPTSIEIPRE